MDMFRFNLTLLGDAANKSRHVCGGVGRIIARPWYIGNALYVGTKLFNHVGLRGLVALLIYG